MLLFNPMVVTTLCLVAITVTGTPTAVDFHVLDPRSNQTSAHSQTNSSVAALALPSVPQLIKRMYPMVKRDKSLFYSGPGVPDGWKLEGQLYAKKHGFTTIWDFGDTATIELATDLGELGTYWRRMSEAYAVSSRGLAWVLMPGDPALGAAEWFPGTIWDTIEWPALQRNAAVTNVFRVNPLSLPAEGVDILPPVWSVPPRRSV